MILKKILGCLIFILAMHGAVAETNKSTALTHSIPATYLAGYAAYPPRVKQLITEALMLSQENLTYLYGSSNPKKGGMDCSGTIYYLLHHLKINDAPRQANQLYEWSWKKGKFYAVNSKNFNSFEFAKLKPGDLLFWSGTYKVRRDPPVTHVMLYLGRNKQGKPLMFGASDGRTYQNQSMWGVSVFDFQLPKNQSAARFLGYSCIPHLTCS